jgi:hypothetical protein
MSSNTGNFYYDRLEEFLPEKKLVAERKLIRVQEAMNTESTIKQERSSPTDGAVITTPELCST